MFVTFAGKIFNTGGEFLNWVIALMLIVALALSALNAIMGCGRSLHQMSVDGQFPRFFQQINEHGVPSRAMGFNVVCSLFVVLAGGAVEIYTFSNVGYTASFIPVLVGYYLLRTYRPDVRRPVRLPNFMKYVALVLAALFTFIWLYGGIKWSQYGDTEVYYFAGWAVLLAYLPLYLYRTRVEDKRDAARPDVAPTTEQPPGAPAGAST
jgi:amino acid transporter